MTKLTDTTPAVPPLIPLERRVCLSLVSIAVVLSLIFTLASDNVAQGLFETIITALFAGFVFAPALTIAAFGGAAIIAFLFDISPEMLLALAVASGLATRTTTGWLLAAFSAVFTLSVAAEAFSGHSNQMTAIVISLLIATVSGATGLLLRSARNREGRLREQLARRAKAEEEIRRSERRIIADELHDVVSHDLTFIVMQTELMALEQRDEQEQLKAQIAIRDAARKALRDLHRLVSAVNEDHIVNLTPPLRLEQILNETSKDLKTAGYPLQSAINLDITQLPQTIDTALAHMLRESVTNVLKHASPGPVSITMRAQGSHVILEVRNSVGKQYRQLTSLPSSKYGTIRMTERASLLGGEFHSHRKAESWVVHARLPLI